MKQTKEHFECLLIDYLNNQFTDYYFMDELLSNFTEQQQTYIKKLTVKDVITEEVR